MVSVLHFLTPFKCSCTWWYVVLFEPDYHAEMMEKVFR